MFDNFWKLIERIRIGKNPPPARVRYAKSDNLNAAAGTRGVFVNGDPGTGKTRYVAMQLFRRFKENPKTTIFVFDWSGALTNTLLDQIARDPDHEKLLERVVLDELGNERYAITKPEFHPDYGLTDEEQVSRVIANLERFAEFMSKTAGFLVGVSVREIGKQLFRLLTVIRNEHGECWQITEALELLMNQKMLKTACEKFGQYSMPAKLYFEEQYLPKDAMPPHEKELTTRALRFLFGMIDSRVARAILGYYRPSWTPKEATEKGQMVIIDAHRMINTPEAQHYLIVQAFSQVMYWINKREVDDPKNERVIIALDETYALLKIDGFAEWLSSISPLYRSRAAELLVILQGLWQLDDRLKEQIWSMGTVISFRRDDSLEAGLLARQLFSYDNRYIKNPPKSRFPDRTG